MPTPKIPGFKPTKRADRRGGITGGGLITYVKDTVIFESAGESSLNATEVTTIRVRQTRRNWLTISNVYTHPTNSTGQVIAFRPDNIPTPDNAIITGDFNAHSPLWDLLQPPDNRGTEVETWTHDDNLNVLNDGTPTRINKITGGESTPDISVIGTKWKDKSKWEVGAQLGNSDHLPITITIHAKVSQYLGNLLNGRETV